MVWHSTLESVENGEISVLAIIETVAAVSMIAVAGYQRVGELAARADRGVSSAVSAAADRAGDRTGAESCIVRGEILQLSRLH
jgi:hypothetical protein